MSIDNAIASLAVKDAAAAVRWYEALFGRRADSIPMAQLAEWRFPRGGWLQVYELPERAGKGSITLAVTDLEGIAAHLKTLGIETSQRTSSAQVNTLTIVDPDGNRIAFAEAFDRTMAH